MRSALLLVFAAAATSAPRVPGPLLEIRLLGQIASDSSRDGDPLRAVVIAPLEVDGKVVLSAGTLVHGAVRRARAVGLGFARERAWIDLEFSAFEPVGGVRAPFSAVLRAIDNGREEVQRSGRIRGILAADGPGGYIRGLWMRPSMGLFPRAAMGLTGGTGMAWSRLALGPVGAVGLFAARSAILRWPEPEIRLPAGTEMRLELGSVPSAAADPPAIAPREAPADLADEPFTLAKPGGRAADDLINAAFLGSRDELSAAFLAAGWVATDPLTRKSFGRAYKAFLTMGGYPAAPVSPMLYRGRLPDVVFQKSLNTIAKRHHIRVWRAGEREGRDLWLAAATHDAAMTFDIRAMTLTHVIDARIDQERTKVISDLLFAGCAEPAAFVDRAAAARERPIETDGRLAVIRLLHCETAATGYSLDVEPLDRGLLSRAIRRTVLETRNYVVRGNVYYHAFKVAQWRPPRPRNGERSSLRSTRDVRPPQPLSTPDSRRSD